MAVDRTLEVMAAVRAALIADAALLTLVASRIYDTAPEKAVSPYLTIGRTSYRDSSSSDSEAQDFDMEVHCWDIPADRANAKNTANVYNAMSHVRRVLHDSNLTISGRNVILTRVTASVSPIADADEIHGVVIVRVLAGHE